MFEAPDSDYLVPFDGSFSVAEASTKPTTDAPTFSKKFRKKYRDELRAYQRLLAAGDRHAVLLVFQAMDAAGKDSTIRSVMRGIDAAGCKVSSFKKPSSLELDHDFLWRTTKELPTRGRIGIFNRSQYEEVLVVRVHPGILDGQQLPDAINRDTIWDDRLQSIREQEAHLARNGTVILKFWLNVSREEQKNRFIRRLDDEKKMWKFNANDVAERRHWDAYMAAYEDALNQTSRPWAPWYAVPADDKPYMRARVSEIIIKSLKSIGLRYPEPSPEDLESYARARKALENE